MPDREYWRPAENDLDHLRRFPATATLCGLEIGLGWYHVPSPKPEQDICQDCIDEERRQIPEPVDPPERMTDEGQHPPKPRPLVRTYWQGEREPLAHISSNPSSDVTRCGKPLHSGDGRWYLRKGGPTKDVCPVCLALQLEAEAEMDQLIAAPVDPIGDAARKASETGEAKIEVDGGQVLEIKALSQFEQDVRELTRLAPHLLHTLEGILVELRRR